MLRNEPPPPRLWRSAEGSREGGRPRVVLEPGKIEQGVVKLVLVLVELLRQVMEKQAMRRIDAGGLTEADIDRLGVSFMQMEATIQSLQSRFGIDDLNIDLGPVGRLLDE